MGAAEFDGDLPRDRQYTGGVRGERVHGRDAAGGLGGRPLRWSGRSWRGPADLPGASAARRQVCDRGSLCGVRAGVPIAAVARDGDRLKHSTLAQYRADLDKRLDRLLSGPEPKPKAARRLFRAMRRDRDDLFRFVTRRDVPYTNNACERALRPSVIFRKVTGGFRAEWGAKVYAAAASVIATGRLYGLRSLAAI